MLFFVSLLLLSFPSALADCPTGTFQGMIPDLCYLTSYTQMTWLHAEYYCNKKGGHLASVQDSYTNKYIAQQLGGYPNVWLGGTTMYVDGQWSWSDLKNFNFTNWATQPQFSNSLCLSTNPYTSNWTAQSCSNTYPFVCEIYEQQNGQPSVKPCPDDWIFIQQEGKCYRHFDNEHNFFTFNDSVQFCKNAGGQLASFHNFAIAAIVGGHANLYNQQFYNTSKPGCGGFIGLISPNGDGNWQWLDGTPLDYIYWAETVSHWNK
uniref:C-type lectin domain-containing protein n=1 Tax=Acrobeloides nanus TaxID=290746 RepID=A0A914EN30_9BILA